MYKIVAYDRIPQYGAYSGNPREVFRSSSRALVERIEQTLRRKERLGQSHIGALYFVRHVKHSGRPE